MDGNGRWALKKNLPRYDGHWKGAEVAEDIIEWCNDRGIKYLTLFSFSTENWKRPQSEINMIFHILAKYLNDRLNKVIEKNARLHFIGDLNALNPNTSYMFEFGTKYIQMHGYGYKSCGKLQWKKRNFEGCSGMGR
jgi:undecaprenyl diphosphate synthase